MRYVTAKEMREIDRKAIEDYGIPGIVLMENAVLKVLKHIPRDRDKYTVIAGAGNNGGDGLGAARHLYIEGKSVSVVLLGSSSKLKGDAKTNFEILVRLSKNKNPENEEIEIIELFGENSDSEEKLEHARGAVMEGEVIVDAIFGTGLSSEVKGLYRDMVESLNQSKGYKVSVDIPSGLNGDIGEPMGTAVKADKTVTLQYPKVGFENPSSKEYTGELVVESISIPPWI